MTSRAIRFSIADPPETALVAATELNREQLQDPEVRLVFQGIRRTIGSAPDQKNPAITADVRAMVDTLKREELSGVRDRALLLIGFAGAFRGSELVSLDVGDVAFSAEGLVVQLRRSKTDQEGQGRKVGLPFGWNLLTCPVRALRDWPTAPPSRVDRSSAPSTATAISSRPD